MMDRRRRSIFFAIFPIAVVLCLLLSGLSPVYALRPPGAGPVETDPHGNPIIFSPVPRENPPNPPSTTPYSAPPIVTNPPRLQKP